MDENYARVYQIMKDIKNTTPVLLMGDAVTVFKKMYSGPIKQVNTTEDVRELVSYYYGFSGLSHPLIIEDLSFLRQQDTALILKLVEESKFPVILLSMYDKIDSILLSRCKTIVKFSMVPLTCNFMPAFKGKEAMDEYLSEDSDVVDKNKWVRDNSPLLYYYQGKIGKFGSIDKMLNILM